MDLQSIAGPIVAAVLPSMPVAVRISTGAGQTADGSRAPSYASPGALTASIAGTVLTVSSVASGALQAGQTVAGAGVAPNTLITGHLSGSAGGAGTYSLNNSQTVGSVAMTTSLSLFGSVQPTTWRDLQQMEGLNIEGVRWKIYLHGQIDGIVRPEKKGGDLVTIPSGPHAGTWLVAQVLEQFPDWVCAAITLQNGA